ncbi:hypothetical protein B0T18DRAFT_474065 [Schizothecium vesticola]|uniref:Uncharacterized protein n=1 Tax=Schizothecium vesticola TaxID=314040 RepID=A0AA40BKL7_9PEZI|nr:hypothetical protein B0T18DRAFT_335458 [Schizothecium vesticola]KAK0738022.1 hypothetical protein B0T18DRAFT_474065 [Schizothecium vesticola]
MHLPTLLLSLLPLSSAFLIPASLPDGLYLAPINGTSAADLQCVDLDALVASHSHSAASTSRRAVDRRQEKTKYAIGRTDRMFPNHGDYNECTDSWRLFFANGGVVKGHFLFLCTYGEAVLAGCNYRNNDFTARYTNPTLVDFFNGVADKQWGTWTTGWVRIKYYDYSFIDFTFWRDLKGTQFCTDLP